MFTLVAPKGSLSTFVIYRQYYPIYYLHYINGGVYDLTTKDFRLNVKISGRTFTEFYEPITESHLNIWETISKSFSKINLKTDVANFCIETEWKSVLDYIKEYVKYSIPVSEYIKLKDKEKKEIIKQIDNIEKKEIQTINCSITTEEEIEHIIFYLEIFLYYFCLLINISAPGACNIKINIINGNSSKEIIFNGYLFESAWVRSLNKGWPNIKKIPFDKAWSWFLKQDIVFKQISETRLEKSLFAILYIACQYHLMDFTTLAWIAHSLESLYDTPRGSISKSLRRRILNVLGTSNKSKKKIRKEISQFYNLRSRFVHGDFNISHPAKIDYFNNNISTNSLKTCESCDFGLSIILATLQKMIDINCNQMTFKEEVYFK